MFHLSFCPNPALHIRLQETIEQHKKISFYLVRGISKEERALIPVPYFICSPLKLKMLALCFILVEAFLGYEWAKICFRYKAYNYKKLSSLSRCMKPKNEISNLHTRRKNLIHAKRVHA